MTRHALSLSRKREVVIRELRRIGRKNSILTPNQIEYLFDRIRQEQANTPGPSHDDRTIQKRP